MRAGGSTGCRTCTTAARLQKQRDYRAAHPLPPRVRKERGVPLYTPEESALATVMQGAKNRCTNPHDAAYKNYGGRGIRFLFVDTRTAVKWVLQNMGPRKEGMTLDRIDNNRHYEPGNLRWATRAEQARNKRAYNGSVYGSRMRLLLKQRTDYTYEGLRKYINRGYNDEQIINMPKPKGGRPKKVNNASSSI